MNMLDVQEYPKNPWTELSLTRDWHLLPGVLWSAQAPDYSPVESLVDISPMALRLLQLDARQLRTHVEGVATLRALHAGACLLPGMTPLAQKYAGHQHGVFNPWLGDGRALLLSEIATPLGRQELYLKGSGRTPYSRNGDGYLGLRSAIREYLVSHALYGLGIPTSLSMSLCVHRRKIMRGRLESSASLLRLAPSHVRIGHFEWLYSRGRADAMQALIKHLGGCYGESHFDDVEHFFRHAVQRAAHLVAAWQVWGFVHGTLNTDNLSVLGTTLDHGTAVFMESYQPALAPAHDDLGGRYAFSSQAQAMSFGLAILAQSLSLLLPLSRLQAILDSYDSQVEEAVLCSMRSRLGLMMSKPEDGELVADWLRLLHRHGADYTRAFRALMDWENNDAADAALAKALGFSCESAFFQRWLFDYRLRLRSECYTQQERYRFMAGVNPVTVLRERFLQKVIDAAREEDFMPLACLRERLVQPFHEMPSEFNW